MAEPIEPSDSTVQAAASASASAAATEVYNSVKVSLADLCAKGTAQYAHKNYDEATDCFARASELQAELNGEMSPENAEILFLYGRSLFKVGQSKSDVLGGRAGGEQQKKTNGSAKPKKAKVETIKEEAGPDRVAEEGVAIIAEQNGSTAKKDEDTDAKKPLFQFTGDENFEDSDDDDAAGEEGEGEEEEDDDLAAAFEVLDLARVLFTRRLEEPEEGEDKGKAVGDSPMTKHIKERLADTHDLLAEISLENEKFAGAVTDFRASLLHKVSLYPKEHEIIAEAHYKLSLALEFASIKEEGVVDQPMRDEAAKELEAAIESTELKLQTKEVELASSSNPDDNDITRERITEVKEIITDMKGRLAELKAPPVDVQALKDNLMGGILGDSIAETPEETKARVEEATKKANDLTGLVRHKKSKAADAGASESTNGKRKADDDAEEGDGAKKAKVEESKEESKEE